MQSLLALWLFERFDLSVATAGTIFFWTGVLSAFSALVAARIAGRIGLLNTAVFTHLPSNVFLVLTPLMPTLPLAIALLLLRSALSQMDVPTRNSYVMAVVSPAERPAAASVTAVPRSLAAALSPLLAGYLLGLSTFGWPLVIGGVLKGIYDVGLWRLFRAGSAAGGDRARVRDAATGCEVGTIRVAGGHCSGQRLGGRRAIDDNATVDPVASGVLASLGWERRQVAAQDEACAVPPEVATARAEGTTIEPIGYGAPVSTPGHGLTLYRFSLPPGEVVPPHRHPGSDHPGGRERSVGVHVAAGEGVGSAENHRRGGTGRWTGNRPGSRRFALLRRGCRPHGAQSGDDPGARALGDVAGERSTGDDPDGMSMGWR